MSLVGGSFHVTFSHRFEQVYQRFARGVDKLLAQADDRFTRVTDDTALSKPSRVEREVNPSLPVSYRRLASVAASLR